MSKRPVIQTKRHVGQDNPLALGLRDKYSNTTQFLIAETDESFYQLISEELIRAIKARLVPGNFNERVHIGLICGLMAYRTAAWLEQHCDLVSGIDGQRIVFVAMNKAADSDAFNLSANYLASYFAKVLPGSEVTAYTDNLYDQNRIERSRQSVDILLCSAGGRSYHEKNYLDRWFSKVPSENKKGIELPPGYIGEFCLTPIDRDGWALRETSFFQQVQEHLDPYPLFTRLADLRQQKMTVIFPVNATPPEQEMDKQPNRQDSILTGKELVTDVVLRSGVVTTCILPKPLAENLAKAIGGYLIEKVSAPEDQKPLRRCQALHFAKNESSPIPVYDAFGRIDETVCTTDSVLRAERFSFKERPKIIFSEYNHEVEHYDWTREDGVIVFEINSEKYGFTLNKDVRRPGQWSLVTSQIVSWLIRKHLQSVAKQSGLDVWDMGSGCGAIGLLAAVHERGLRLLFSDIDQQAIDCTKDNAKKLLTSDHQAPRFVRGSLFEVNDPKQKRFHLIAFNPPFLPVQDLSINPSVDAGGNLGLEIAESYCEAVYDHLEVGGWSVLALADYVDNGKIKQILGNRFGASNVDCRERVILYPFRPEQPDVPAAYEVRYRSTIEQACRYRFETCVLGKQSYLAFKMRHYLAQRK
jgi:hypothetical protein